MSAIVDGDPGIAAVFAADDRMWVPVIVLGEYRYGLIQSKRRTEYESWIERRVQPDRVLSIDATTSRFYAEIRLELKRRRHAYPGQRP